MVVIGLLVCAYLLGAIPASYWLCLTRGIDIQQYGSHNPGATNALRVMKSQLGSATGWTYGLVGLACDILKGVLAVKITFPWAESFPWLGVAAGLAALLGNMFSVFLGFRGGKGVAVSAGVFMSLAPISLSVSLVVFGVIFGVTRIVSLGSMVVAIFFPMAIFVQWYWHFPAPVSGWVFLLACVACVVVLYRHKTNFIRMIKGNEDTLNDSVTTNTEPPPSSKEVS